MPRALRAVILCVSALLGAALPGAAGTAELLADLNLVPSFGAGSSYGVQEPLLVLGDRLLFNAYEPSTGVELWVSDGTFQGTRLLVDLTPGGESTSFRVLGTVRQTAVLLRDLGFGSGPWALWRSDGTKAGTFPLDPLTAFESCVFGTHLESVLLGDRLFFLASTSTAGCGLWQTDGTVGGTRLVEEVDDGARDLVTAGNRLFFGSESGGLWTSDGTGAVRLRELETSDREGPRQLTAVGSRVAFLAEAVEGGGEELWISDGTVAGTRARTRFFEPSPFGFGESSFLKAFGNTVYFTADDGTGIDLWSVEATGTAPRRVTDFIHKTPFSIPFAADHLVRLGDRLVFRAREEGSFRDELWVSRGTPPSTAPLSGCPGGCPTPESGFLAQIGRRALFLGRDAQGRLALWATDGTGAGTRRLADTFVLRTPVLLLGRLYFIGSGSSEGFALWRSDGTAAGTVRVADLGLRAFDFDLGFFPASLGGKIFFAANLDTQEAQLWVSDGSAEGTRAISSLRDAPGSYPGAFTPIAGGVLFSANRASSGDDRILWRTDGSAAGTYTLPAVAGPRSIQTAANGLGFVLAGLGLFPDSFEVWRTDGTVAGTFRVDPPGLGTLDNLAPFGNGVVFAARRQDGRIAFWKSDGTLAGTSLLLELPADVTRVRSLQALGSRLYFVAGRLPDDFADQLWVSDGTAAGTQALVADGIIDLRSPFPMAQAGGTVWFADRFGLWKTDGTAAGTVRVMEVLSEDARPTDLIEFQGALYFLAGDRESSTEPGLWRTDGTPGGTVLVKAGGIPAPDYLDDRTRLVRLGDRLLFLADDGVHGGELWSSDGTAAGTVLVRDIAPGEASATPPLPEEASLTLAGGRVYFPATDGTSGFELWESDGTAAGTRRVQDIAPGGLSSFPRELAAVGDRLFFAADDGVHGVEPWILPVAGGGCVPSTTALCLGGRFRVEADWRDFQGNRGRGRAAALTADTGYFWFFDAANVEVILKVLDGRGVNGHHWVFYGALSNVEYTLTVTDTETGAVRRYFNPARVLGSVADTEAFGPRGATLAGVVSEGPAPRSTGVSIRGRTAPEETGSCTPGAARLCLNGGRFAVEVRWKTPGATGTGKAVPLEGGDTGYLWFFDASNVEVVVKVLDGRAVNGKFWVFYGALSDVEYTLTVTDTVTGAVKTYTNPKGRLASVADTGAF